jgi:hypothetical protein
LQVRSGCLKFASLVALGLMAFARGGGAADFPSTFSGNLLGYVVDPLGTPQMGASVALYDHYQRLVRKTLTSPDGRFGFEGLPPEQYSVRISIPSFIPATRDKIAIRAGLSSVLQIRMATILSSVEVRYSVPTAAMSDDWKWVLRASSATRAVTRFLPAKAQTSSSPQNPEKIFSDIRGSVSLSAGDAGSLISDAGSSGFGTSFALATSVYGRNQINLSGAFGQSIRTGMPTMGVRATYARTSEDSQTAALPELTLMARQVSLVGRSPESDVTGGSYALRSTTLSYYDSMDILDKVRLEYGAGSESVSYFDRVSHVSPYARATVSLGGLGSVAATFSDGGAPNDLYMHQFGQESELAGTVSAVGDLPQFSLRGSHLQLQRTQNVEVGYVNTAGRRTYAVSAFYENVKDGRLNVAGDLSGLGAGNVLADVSTDIAIYNIGQYNRNGVIASVNQKLSNELDVTLAGGTEGGFTRIGDIGRDASTFLQRDKHPVASLSIRSTLPLLNTRFTGSYEYVSGDAIVPRHVFSTQNLYGEPGLNILIRQPLPSFFGMGRLEISADLRNLLAQGYLPITGSDGRQTLLVQAPRAVRGGLNFIF